MALRGASGKTVGFMTWKPTMPASRRRFLTQLACTSWATTWLSRAQARTGTMAPGWLLATEALADVDPTGYLVSEKYDGVRALWDGHQLRLRSGTTVAAPAWLAAGLPAVPLDGELWLGRGRFEAVSGLVRSQRLDDPAWHDVRLMVFDLPGAPGGFAQRAQHIQGLAASARPGSWLAVQHAKVGDTAALQARLAQVVSAGGEGLMLHRADAPWESGRSGALLKLKPLHDADAQVLAHLPGRGRHQGRLGALRVRTEGGAEFRLGTGFSDALREAPPPVGSWISYTHRGHTARGLPRFASFLRLRPDLGGSTVRAG